MKIIQTTINCIDSQSRIIYVDLNSFDEFKKIIIAHLSNGLKDDEIQVIKSYPFDKGLTIPSMHWYDINQNDDIHLDITFVRDGLIDNERVCFTYVFRE